MGQNPKSLAQNSLVREQRLNHSAAVKDERKYISTVWRQPEGRVGVEVGKGELSGERKNLDFGW